MNTQKEIINTQALEIPKPKQSRRDLASRIVITFVALFVICMLILLLVFIAYKSSGVADKIGVINFIFGTKWNPGNADSNSFGIMTLISSTLLLLIYTLIICVPITIFASLFIAEYLNQRVKKIVTTVIQLLAGIPSVVFGIFAFDQIGSLTVKLGASSNGNLTTAAITLAFMALPTMITLSINAIESVPDGYRWGALAIGATKERTTVRIVFRSALKGIISSIVIGIARIIGETMAVILIAGNATKGADLSHGFNGFIFSSIRTLAGTIGLEMLENSGAKHESALYAIGLFLFFLIIIINLIILFVSRDKTKSRNKKANLKIRLFKKQSSIEKYTVVFSKDELKELVTLNRTRFFWMKLQSFFIRTIMVIATLSVMLFVFWILGTVFVKGIDGWKWNNFIKLNGQKSGIFAALFATLLLVFLTTVITVPIALFVAIYLSQYTYKNSKIVSVIRFSINVLSSTPSIVFGVFGLTLFVQIMQVGISITSAALTMSFVIMPTLIINFEDALLSVSEANTVAGFGMGLRKISVITKVIIPCASKGIFTGIILAVARIIGEAAPIYLTMGTVVRNPANGFLSPGASLTTIIYMLSTESSSPTSTGDSFQISLVLILFVLFIIFIGEFTARHLDNTIIKKMTFAQRLKKLESQVKDIYKDKVVKIVKKESYQWIKKSINKCKTKNVKKQITFVKQRNKRIKEIYANAQRVIKENDND